MRRGASDSICRACRTTFPDQSYIEGVDFGTLAEGGRIASITGFFGPLT